MSIKTVVSGIGRIGWEYHIPHVVAHPGYELVGACDPSGERRDDLVRDYPGTRAWADFDDMIAQAGAQLLVIASPTNFHRSQAIAAMEAGMDVFCDKPVAPTQADFEDMQATSERTGRKLMVFQPQRLSAASQMIKKLMNDPRLGGVYMVQDIGNDYHRREDWQTRRADGGGMLNNYVSHALDRVLYALGGAKVSSVMGVMKSVACLGDAEDVVKILANTAQGVAIDLEVNMADAQGTRYITVRGKTGAAVGQMIEGEDLRVTLRWFDPAAAPPVAMQEGVAAAGRKYRQPDALPWQTETWVQGKDPTNFYDLLHDYLSGGESFVPLAQTHELVRVQQLIRDQN